MEVAVKFVALISAIAIVPAFVASFIASYRLDRYVRQKHPEVWAEIEAVPGAEPSLSSPGTRWVTQRTYRHIPDPQLHRLGDKAYHCLYVAVFTLVVLILSMLLAGALGW
ncbi:hypothetical protein ACFFGH_32350 [Lysobacter korlensis]|uniref:Universal stress protein B n=1 Tax=Lysobacter korlensis TaxID=553636 RepID=A0ABV6RZZ4_9GAMM